MDSIVYLRAHSKQLLTFFSTNWLKGYKIMRALPNNPSVNSLPVSWFRNEIIPCFHPPAGSDFSRSQRLNGSVPLMNSENPFVQQRIFPNELLNWITAGPADRRRVSYGIKFGDFVKEWYELPLLLRLTLNYFAHLHAKRNKDPRKQLGIFNHGLNITRRHN